MKKCRECLIEKDLSHFPKNKDSKDGYRNICKSCQSIKDKARSKSKLSICKICGKETGNRYNICSKCKNEYENYSRDNCDCGNIKQKRSNSCSECYMKSITYRYNKKGYVIIRTKMNHPRNKYNEMFEHTLVMEAYLGRYLYPGENVHHRNGIKDDNRIDNLELWTKPQPSGIRVEDAIEWAKEILNRYENYYPT